MQDVSVRLNNGRALKLKVLAQALCAKDLYGTAPNKTQVKVFTEGQQYPVTRIQKDHWICIDNSGEEHFVLRGGWQDHFKIVRKLNMRKSAEKKH